MNKEILLIVKKRILEHPENFDMRWVGRASVDLTNTLSRQEVKWNCGTTACISGWAMVLSGFSCELPEVKRYISSNTAYVEFDKPDEDFSSISDGFYAGIKVLELSRSQAYKLLIHTRWDSPYKEQYEEALEANNQKRCAQIAAEYIDYFISNYDS